MKRICIYVALGVLGAFSAHAQEINIGQTVARKISDDKVEVSFSMDCSTLRLPSRRQMVITPLIISRSESGARLRGLRDLKDVTSNGKEAGTKAMQVNVLSEDAVKNLQKLGGI